MIALTCPGAMKPSIFKSPTPNNNSIAGGINLWDTKKLKFAGGSPSASTAVEGAVVSKPTAEKTNSLFFSRFAISTASETL